MACSGTAFTRNSSMTHASANEREITPNPVGLTVKVAFAAPEGKSQIGTIMTSKNTVSVLRTEGVSQAAKYYCTYMFASQILAHHAIWTSLNLAGMYF